MSEEAKGRKAFEGDTVLYHPAMGAKLFTADDAHPGDEWSDTPAATGVEIAQQTSVGGDIADLIAAAVEKALAEQKAKFDKAWGEISSEKRRTDDENADLRRDIASRDEDIRQLNSKVTEQAGDLTSREGVILDLRDQVAQQAALIAKFDPDGDGKPGGSAPKAAPKK